MLWDPTREEWLAFGSPTLDGKPVAVFSHIAPFVHVDAEDSLSFVDGHGVFKSTRPVH